MLSYVVRGCYSNVVEDMFDCVSKSSKIGIYRAESDRGHFITLVYRGDENRCDVFSIDENTLEQIAVAHKSLSIEPLGLKVETID